MSLTKTQNPKVANIAREIETLNEQNRTAFDAEDQERQKNADFNMAESERKAIIDRNKKIEALDADLAEATEIEGIRGQTETRRSALRSTGAAAAAGAPIHAPTAPAAGRGRTLGDVFANSEVWREFTAKHPNGLPKSFRTDPVNVGSFLPPQRRADVVDIDTGSSGTLTGADRQADVSRIPFYEVNIFDVISRRTTTSDLVEYVRQTSRNTRAAFVPDATTDSSVDSDPTNTMGVKPQSDFGLKIIQEPVKTLAHWAAATRRSLADIGQLKGIIDDELLEGLRDVLADQVLNGDGAGENFKGLNEMTNATDGITEQAFITDLLTTTRRARTTALINGRTRPNAYVMSPATWEAVELSQDGQQRYYFAAPQSLATPRLWGLPVVEEVRQPDDVILTGDLRQATLWDRMQATIYTTDSHLDFFVRNLIAVLAEQRAAFGVRRPAAIVLVDVSS